MKNKEIRAKAREALYDNWGKYIGLNLLYMLIVFLISFVSAFIPFIGSIAVLILSIPLSYGYIMNLVKLKTGETDKVTDFLSLTFDNFGRAWAVYGWTLVKLLLPFILFFVVYFLLIIGIVISVITQEIVIIALVSIIGGLAVFATYIFLMCVSLLYIYPQYIAAYNPNKLPKDCVEHSAKLMKGKRLKYIGLMLSFLGWMILATLTCGIGYIFLAPYLTLAIMCFYEDLDKENLDGTAVVADGVTPVIETK